MDISLIVPVYNEAEVLYAFFERLNGVFSSSEELKDLEYEVICVDDGSTDSTPSILEDLLSRDSRIKLISFSRNFGKEAAMFAGLKFASGKCAVPIDADLQDPPELIAEFVKKWREGFDMVYGVRVERSGDSPAKRKTAELFYKIYNSLSERPIPRNTGDFRLIDRRVIDAILKLHERSIFMKGIFNWVGFKSVGVPYDRPERVSGGSKWNYWKLWNFALDGITASSTIPLRIWTYIGGAIASITGIYALYIALRTIVCGVDVPGYASLFVSILFFGSVQLIALGIFGEYLGRIVAEVKGRPLYVIEKISSNLAEPKE